MDRNLREERPSWGGDRTNQSVALPTSGPAEKQHFRVKIFKSGNSLAVRLPAGLGFQAGMEMDMEVRNERVLTLEPADRPKRKFNVAKVCGSATNLAPLADEDRLLQSRPLAWPRPEADGDAA